MFSKQNSEITPSEVAKRLAITRQGVMRYIDSGKLKAEKRGSRWFILTSDLNQFIQDNINRNY